MSVLVREVESMEGVLRLDGCNEGHSGENPISPLKSHVMQSSQV